MKKPLLEKLDDFGRRHPWLMLILVIIMAAVVTPILLYMNEGPVVLYQAF